ncbi:phosphotransferase [Synechococcus sp. CS-602]|uniref:phosphotransferase enzyme family protein n=1 Tax=Synechococcaceae TaxID=1890426 RepID=UPI0008FF6E36|nr:MULTISPECIES: phosphotransferase [Synechococcaceae]MCT4364308.1 phosphotransferase [Candidatus Regnicoccus frigidus MAG-AL1]APD48889.1 aminoglycoside phosphotransferase [Synechococcus sp. SynAce01]MCT0202364.1 phosphotransferase [Synechococcus sp. CS-603]MCT0203756.1 phosphotransferase [Synechococcus sp. CS-602]MCT0246445.1 phosphotransferase [Synechococcus sp. CS-601]
MPEGLQLAEIAAQFLLDAPVAAIEPLGNGQVNDTYRVRLEGSESPCFVLQRLNTQVFPQPELVMGNLVQFSAHVERRLRQGFPGLRGRRWEVPRILPARQGTQSWLEADGSFWRLVSFVANSESFETIDGLAQAREVGHGLGLFHALISDLPVEGLADTLVGFHITPTYLEQYHAVLGTGPISDDPDVAFCRAFVGEREWGVAVLEEAKARGDLPLRPIHGDPKINNMLMDVASGEAIALVDLDTVKPGLVHYDIGDCLRSCCNPLGEETSDWAAVRFDPQLCDAILQGYAAAAGSFLTPTDYDYLYAAIRLIPLELGLRFFSDYLAGNTYFKTRYPRHNLDRALVQFRLTASIEEQETAIRSIIDGLR